MTGSIALDIVIGLVFIYALYSLMTTTIMEFIALIFQLRARNLKRALRRLFNDDSLYTEFINTPIIKNLYSNRFSWFFNVNTFPSYIDSKTFTNALNYMLLFKEGIQKLDKKDVQTVLDKIREEIYKPENDAKDTFKYLRFLFETSNNKLDKFIKSLEEWYDAAMERCVGWFKKNMTFLTFGVSFIMAMLFNIDSLQIIDQLSKDPDAREQYVELAGQVLSNPQITGASTVFDTTLENRLLSDTALFVDCEKDSSKLRDFVTDSVNQQFIVIKKELKSRIDTLYSTSKLSQSILSFKREKRPPWFFDSWLNLLGCLITALALSLGAPFWFDLLNKFMKLRTSLGTATKKAVNAANLPADVVEG